MINFMVIGAPRSGTAWAANWLTTEWSLCMHDVLFQHQPEDLDSIVCDRLLGVSDTGLALFPEWLSTHPAKKIVLHRDPREIDASLRKAGLSGLERDWNRDLYEITGPNVTHIDWQVLFDAPGFVHHFLFGDRPVDWQRHNILKRLNVQADFEKIDPDPVVTARLLERMRRDVR